MIISRESLKDLGFRCKFVPIFSSVASRLVPPGLLRMLKWYKKKVNSDGPVSAIVIVGDMETAVQALDTFGLIGIGSGFSVRIMTPRELADERLHPVIDVDLLCLDLFGNLDSLNRLELESLDMTILEREKRGKATVIATDWDVQGKSDSLEFILKDSFKMVRNFVSYKQKVD